MTFIKIKIFITYQFATFLNFLKSIKLRFEIFQFLINFIYFIIILLLSILHSTVCMTDNSTCSYSTNSS